MLKRPNIQEIKQEGLSVNISQKWERLEKEILATGICEEFGVKNPYSEELGQSNFFPWIGPDSRCSDVVPSTEFLKGLRSNTNLQASSSKACVNEDSILTLLESKKVTKSELTKACADLGVSTEGSETDLINRLEEMLLYKDIYPKMYAKLQRTGGGVLHMGCTHAVTYYFSPLLWTESARDHADGLLSFAHPPTVYISDVAGRVARHTNIRTKKTFFHPNDGRLCETSQENIKAAQDKTLEIKLPWLKNIQFKGRWHEGEELEEQLEQPERPHPVTGSTERYSLYDAFHQKKQTRPEEILRSLKLVPELAAMVNSSEAEQKNRELSHDKYFLCQIKEQHFLFCLCLVFNLHNEAINNKFR